MKKTLTLLALLVLLLLPAALHAAPTPSRVELEKGYVLVYDFGDIRLHSYATNDPMNDQCFIFEKGDALVLLEMPAFHSNFGEYRAYVDKLGKKPAGILISYHPSGPDYFGDIPVYSNPATARSIHQGALKAMLTGFVSAFGPDFNTHVLHATETITADTITIGGIDFNIHHNDEGFDLDVPAIGVLYTHMLGEKVHSIIGGREQIDVMLKTLSDYRAKNYALILTSHHEPEPPTALAAKMAYLEETKKIAQAGSQESFITNMKNTFPDYTGEGYLEMTAAALYRR